MEVTVAASFAVAVEHEAEAFERVQFRPELNLLAWKPAVRKERHRRAASLGPLPKRFDRADEVCDRDHADDGVERAVREGQREIAVQVVHDAAGQLGFRIGYT